MPKAFAHREEIQAAIKVIERLGSVRNEKMLHTLLSCTNTRCKQLNYLFDSSRPWSEIRNRSVSFEEVFAPRSLNKSDSTDQSPLLSGRFWLDKPNSEKCLTPLDGHENSICIAGEEVKDNSADTSALIEPFSRMVRLSNGASRKYSSSEEWRKFSVSKHQHQLISETKVVARYVWYAWDYYPFFGLSGTCPNPNLGSTSQDRFFWSSILSKAPYKLLLKQQ